MKLLNLFNVTFMVISTTLAIPSPRPQGVLPPDPGPQFYLRCYAPDQPWHKRHLILLPTSQLLGLENFTVHPTTRPVTFNPIQLPSETSYALRLPDGSDDLTYTPYISAILADATRTSIFGVRRGPDPHHVSPCPEGRRCAADSFSMYAGENGEKRKLSFEAFPGVFEAVKDAPNGEGWHIYWRGSGGPAAEGTQIELEVVPIEEYGKPGSYEILLDSDDTPK